MNNSSIVDKNKSLYSLVITLFSINTYLVYIISPELSKLFGYTDSNTMLIKQLIPITIGVIIAYTLSRFNPKVWFNRIGATIFVLSIILLVMMLIVPTSLTSQVSGQKLYIVLGGISVSPMVFFPVGSLWLIGWIASKNSKKTINTSILILMVITALFCIKFNDVRTLLMLETLFIALLVYINSLNKFTIISIFTALAAGLFFILSAEHRVQRISLWWESSSNFMTTLAIGSVLHENILLTLINNLGTFSFMVVVLLFMLVSYIIFIYNYEDLSYKIFSVGVVFLILIDLILNTLYIFGLSPIYPPSLYLFGYGSSVVLASFIIVGMLTMTHSKELK